MVLIEIVELVVDIDGSLHLIVDLGKLIEGDITGFILIFKFIKNLAGVIVAHI
jgi:hypothetical protein